MDKDDTLLIGKIVGVHGVTPGDASELSAGFGFLITLGGNQRFQAFLVGHAKALFLVHDNKAQILEPGVLRQDRVGADDDIDCAISQPVSRFLHLLGGDKARQAPDFEGEAPKTLAKILVMLIKAPND